jgi:hypothetical protein
LALVLPGSQTTRMYAYSTYSTGTRQGRSGERLRTAARRLRVLSEWRDARVRPLQRDDRPLLTSAEMFFDGEPDVAGDLAEERG